eukprot:7330271-Alexandrium_andersonii.AAC.1
MPIRTSSRSASARPRSRRPPCRRAGERSPGRLVGQGWHAYRWESGANEERAPRKNDREG